MPITQIFPGLLAQAAGGEPPAVVTATRSAEGGSLFFAGLNSYVQFAASADWAVGTGDYTIEWWQWLLPTAQYPRPFSLGTYPSASFAVSIESGTFYLWGNGSIINATAVSNFFDQWVHFAVCRLSNQTTIFQNGQSIDSFVDNTNLADNTTALTLGNESVPTQAALFYGYLTNFRWTKGEAIYTGNFVPPNEPLSAGANTKLLLLSTSDGNKVVDTSGSHTATGSIVDWAGVGPYSQRAWLDAGNPSSYSDPSVSWLDLSGFNNDVNLTQATYNAGVGGHLIFGATGGGVFATNLAAQNSNTLPSAAITMWINAQDNSGFNFVAGMRSGGVDFQFFFLLLEDTNQTEARVVTTSGVFDINVSFNAYYNTWCHVGFTVNGDRSDLYLNGNLVGSNTNITGTWGTAPSEFTIAREAEGWNQTPNLKMAVLRYHTRARTSAEILAEFTAEQARFGL